MESMRLQSLMGAHHGKENVSSTLPSAFVMANLTASEQVVWQKCALEHLRLEQENIPREVWEAVLERTASG